MFNSHLKEKYISENAKSNMPKLKRIFEETSMHEIMLDKDLFDFNLDELQSVLFNFMPKNVAQVNEKIRLIKNYIDYSILQGLKQSNLNPLSGLSPEWKNQFLENME